MDQQEGQQAEYWTFPTDLEEFDKDERISFSKLDNKYIAVQDDGTEYEFDEGLKRWLPIIDEALIEEHQRAYITSLGDDDTETGQSGKGQGKKRKNNDREDSASSNNMNNQRPPKNQKREKAPREPKQNTAVYVTGLPLDATADEVAELFSRKCGVIAEEIDSGRPRIKMYTDANGKFKGDALIVFFKPQSVEMAIMLLDDTDFRLEPSPDGSRMRVQAADMSYKKTNYVAAGAEKNGGGDSAEGGNGEGSSSAIPYNNITNPAPAPNNNNNNGGGNGDNRRSAQDKAKIIKKTQKLSAKLADWDDDEPSPSARLLGPAIKEAKGGKWDKVVILRHMFTLEELNEDPAALLEIKDDIREECAKLGPVTNVVLFDQEEEGIVSVKFATVEAAEACVHLMHGRAFDGRIVEAFFATGKERFKKSKNKDAGEAEEEGDE
ncbi:hypothetical protein QBC32DRAFT_101781 [Pseudoneurospora amorphoporcata]|uniref:RRM domain-containing protein n=1 Tax=Pseudoneurospora amorphoporcata TaxID=241081 RepID=A0AAN6SHW9_9PEZI|nr:hypothetical protein QBC32DRAFT_101781 [Pseudoneurospora amorphoporcata]